jgi:hypothetical protein
MMEARGIGSFIGPGTLSAVARRPDLWRTALGEWRALCPERWWARWPPLPLPSRAYFGFRLEAMYGAGANRRAGDASSEHGSHGSRAGVPSACEVVAYLEWCRRMAAIVR